MANNDSLWQLFLIFLKLGCTSFGGPVAHIGFFHTEFVSKRQWLSERDYADLVALCQFLPGPASSQVGMALGMLRAHYAGALVAWLGFTLPSALLLIGCAYGLQYGHAYLPAGLLQGLKIVAVAIVAQAVWGMAKTLCDTTAKVTVMIAALLLLAVWHSVWSQVAVIGAGALAGFIWLRTSGATATPAPLPLRLSGKAGLCWGLGFVVLLLLLPLLSAAVADPALDLFDAFFRAGALVFGGGHVVLPLLQAEVVPTGLVAADTFMAGYGAAQAVPGPLFTFAAFLGASMQQGPSGFYGAALALCAIFLPAFLLLAAVLPFWQRLRSHNEAQAMLAGVGATVVAILSAALYDPVWTSTIHSRQDFAAAALALVALMHWKIKPWQVVLAGATAGTLCY